MSAVPYNPSAKVSRPLSSSVTVAAPSQQAAGQASSPHRSWVSASKAAAVPTLASAATSRGPSSQPRGGNSTL